MLDLLKLELDRARKKYPAKMTLPNFIGCVWIKMAGIIRRTEGHKHVHNPESKPVIILLCLHIAAMCIRLSEECLGSMSEEEYRRLSDAHFTTKGINS